MTDKHIERLGKRYQAGERSRSLLSEMTSAMRAVESGQADCGFGRDLEAAIANLREHLEHQIELNTICLNENKR